jgi:uncharacterized protein YutE (UPF0331/DUF86 family)
MNRDVILNKKESLERCIKQVREYYARPSDVEFKEDHLRQDAIAVNLQRATELAIDMANHVIKERKLGLPKESRQSFELLGTSGIIPQELARTLQGMVGFRNILVHEYQKLDIEIMIDIIENRLRDMIDFSNLLLRSE